MPIPQGFVRQLAQWARESPANLQQLRDERDQLRIAQIPAAPAGAANAGASVGAAKDLVQSTVNGKSWAWQVNMTTAERFTAWGEALEIAERRRITRTRAVHRTW